MQQALDTAARACSRGARPRDRATASRAVAGLVRLSRTYPTQRFRLQSGGEEGNMLAVLLVARSELSCAPRITDIIDRALPPRVRAAVRGGSSPTR